MCTGFVKKGNDIIFGYNLDIDPSVWAYSLVKTDKLFSVAIKVGATTYYTHGVTAEGKFSVLPYANDEQLCHGASKKGTARVDLLTHRYLLGKYGFADVLNIAQNKKIVNVKNCSMHALFADESGDVLLVEPLRGYKLIEQNFAVVSNYPLLTQVTDFKPWFGKERQEIATQILQSSDDDFTAMDGLNLLGRVAQQGIWATRVSFAYSHNERCVYYVMDGDFANIQKHCFGKSHQVK